MATYFAFFTRNSPLYLPKKRSYLTHLLKYESQFYNRTQVYRLSFKASAYTFSALSLASVCSTIACG